MGNYHIYLHLRGLNLFFVTAMQNKDQRRFDSFPQYSPTRSSRISSSETPKADFSEKNFTAKGNKGSLVNPKSTLYIISMKSSMPYVPAKLAYENTLEDLSEAS